MSIKENIRAIIGHDEFKEVDKILMDLHIDHMFPAQMIIGLCFEILRLQDIVDTQQEEIEQYRYNDE